MAFCFLIYSSFASLCENRSLIDLLVNRLNNLSVAFVTIVPVISDFFTKRLRGATLLEVVIKQKLYSDWYYVFSFTPLSLLFVKIDL